MRKRAIWIVASISAFIVVSVLIVKFGMVVRQNRRDADILAAVRHNDAHTVTILLAEGADADLHSMRGGASSIFGRWLALWTHTPQSRSEPPNALLEAMIIGEEARDGSRELAENNAIVTALVEHGADVNRYKYANETPLRSAIGWYRIDIVRLLLAHGADPNQGDSETGTVLYGELYQGLSAHTTPRQNRIHAEIIKLLRKARAKE